MARKLVIFADGTGNAFSTQESNVWRLYQALDQQAPDQIARYIKGVGTSGFRPWAMIDGATGVGVPSNVRELYRFLCWNWEQGDEIYLFGFSRGAFTIRTLVGLVSSQGLMPRAVGGVPVSHTDMQANTRTAWRAYRAGTVKSRWQDSAPTIWVTRWIRDMVLAGARLITRQPDIEALRREVEAQGRRGIKIRFLGLFDTVEAFGVPFDELRTAIDRTIWPLSFRNRVLSPIVETARHALALDEERLTFRPLRFDQSAENGGGRIKEVWFAGVHSDIGGGYPDEALAYVPLAWMAGEAAGWASDAQGQPIATGLRFSPGAVEAFEEKSSSFGPRHDSRAGMQVIYRYAPRRILEDAACGGPPVIHHSVVERMAFGSDAYAPLTLPSTAEVLMPGGEKARLQGWPGQAFAAPVEATRAAAALKRLGTPSKALVSLTRDFIWWRRVAYFALVAALFGLALLPLTAAAISRLIWGVLPAGRMVEGGIAAVIDRIARVLSSFLPDYTATWVDTIVLYPAVSAGMIVLTLLLLAWNGSLRDRIAEHARGAWFPRAKEALQERQGAKGRQSDRRWDLRLARRLRKSTRAHAVYGWVSGKLLPWLALGVAALGLAVLVSRGTIIYRAGNGELCGPGPGAVQNSLFSPAMPCWASGQTVRKGLRYTIRIEMTAPFLDRSYVSGLAGFPSPSFIHTVSTPLKRRLDADWFQPIARIGASGHAEWPLVSTTGWAEVKPGDVRQVNGGAAPGWCHPASAAGVAPPPEGERAFVAEFLAPEDGELFLYVNDAIFALPLLPTATCFYANNGGQARVTLSREESPAAP